MTHFPIQWQGNKRKELGRILPHIPAGCRVLVEPFAGSAAVSTAHWLESTDRDACSYVFGDQDPGLCAFVEALRVEGLDVFVDWVRARLNAEAFMAIERGDPANDTTREWFYRRKVRRGIFDPKKELPRKWPSLNITASQRAGAEFFRTARLEVRNVDWLETARAHASDPFAVIYLDPPYFSAYNQWYHGRDALTAEGVVVDGTELFVDMARVLRDSAATVIISTNGLAILTNLFSPFVREVYAVKYTNPIKRKTGEYVHKGARHLIAARTAVAPLTDADILELFGF
jgi:site-specific DNA-adenine methylase